MPCQSFRPAISLPFSGFFLPNGVAELWRVEVLSRQAHDHCANISTVVSWVYHAVGFLDKINKN